jgi:hypothetical protein
MAHVATPATRPVGAPKYSDVCLRYGWVRSTFPTVADAKALIAGFHATRVDWFYPGSHSANGTAITQASRDFIAWCHQKGMKIGGAMNTNTTELAWRLKDGPGTRYIGDPSIAAYINAAVAWGKAQIDAGLDALVCDDFFYYNSSQKSVFDQLVIAAIKAYRPGFAVASNNGSFLGTDYVTHYSFDFHYSDNNFAPTPGQWWQISKDHRVQRSAAIAHPNIALDRWSYRTQIALGYATGSHVIMPWDEYIHGSARAFGDPADYADVSAFARCLGQRGLLDGYEDAAVGGYELTETRYGTAPLAVSAGNQSVSLLARAKPGDTTAAVVVHIVKWSGTGASTLRLLTASFFGGAPLDIELWTRKPYQAAEHSAAEKSGDFSALYWDRTKDSKITIKGDWTEVEIPELYSWGVLVVKDGSRAVQDAGADSAPDAGVDTRSDTGQADGSQADSGVADQLSADVSTYDAKAERDSATHADSAVGNKSTSGGCRLANSDDSSDHSAVYVILIVLVLTWARRRW